MWRVYLKKIIVLAGLWSAGVAAWLFFSGVLAPVKTLEPLRLVVRRIPEGVTFGQLASQVGIAGDTIAEFVAGTKHVYDVATIKAGKAVHFYVDRGTGDLKRLAYDVNTETSFIVERAADGGWSAATSAIPYEIRTRRANGIISSTLYDAVRSQRIDDRFTLLLAEMFAWQIDFAADIQAGDSFKAVYEERYLDGRYVMPVKILAAEFINNGERFLGFYFEWKETKAGHYDENGNALVRVFLKSPLQYKYISSGFTYRRVNPVTGAVRPHRGIDYAAAYGTPAVSVGDGTVVQAGWNGPYGISVKVRHNDTYSTVYGHFQSLARGIRRGAKVQQGQVVGYVGSTGESTGPHLHYEMHKFGALVNPFRVEIPPGEPVAEADRPQFEEVKARGLAALGEFRASGGCTVRIGEAALDVEIADDEDERARGLSERPDLAQNQGMLFMFPQPGRYAFWMRGMRFPIDIIWVSAKKEVIGVTAGIRLDDASLSYEPPGDILYAIETNSGWAEANDIQAGSRVEISCPPPNHE